MPTAKSLLGKRAEEIAATELKRRNYEVVCTNYRCRGGEIDIIAMDGSTLVFVEVRSRRSDCQEYPSESVDARKQSKLILTARHYLVNNELSEDTDCRFDVVAVTFIHGRPVGVEVIRNAFMEC